MPNRRRSLRVPQDLSVEWKRGARHVEARAANISAHGVLIRTDEGVAVNQVMDLVVHLPGHSVSFLGVSRFVGDTRWGHGVGASIHVMSSEDQVRWASYYERVAAQRVASLPPSVRKLLGH